MTLKTPMFLENDTTTQNSDEARLLIEATQRKQPGVPSPSDMTVVQRGAGANMSVDIGSGHAFIDGTENAHQGMYHAYNNATVNIAVTTADGANPRIDAVIVFVNDAFYSGAANNAEFAVVAGTPAGSPVAPNPASAGYDNYLILAYVDVPANDTTITNSQITDMRARVPMGLLNVATVADISAPFEGLRAYERTNDREMIYSGTGWVEMGRWGQFQNFTPVGLNGNGTPTQVTEWGRYQRNGRRIKASARVRCTSAVAFSQLLMTLPIVGAMTSANTTPIGQMTFLDASTGIFYIGSAFMFSAPGYIFGFESAAANPMQLDLANNDIMSYDVDYEAAT